MKRCSKIEPILDEPSSGRGDEGDEESANNDGDSVQGTRKDSGAVLELLNVIKPSPVSKLPPIGGNVISSVTALPPINQQPQQLLTQQETQSQSQPEAPTSSSRSNTAVENTNAILPSKIGTNIGKSRGKFLKGADRVKHVNKVKARTPDEKLGFMGGAEYDACISFPIKEEIVKEELNARKEGGSFEHLKYEVNHLMHYENATVLLDRIPTGDHEDWDVIRRLISEESRKVLNKFRKRNFELKAFRKERILFCLMRCPHAFMQNFASTIDFPLLLDGQEAFDYSQKLEHIGIAPLNIPGPDHKVVGNVSSIYPFQYIYAKYEFQKYSTSEENINEVKLEDSVPEAIYWRPKDFQHPFYPYVRLRLLKYMSESHATGGMALKMEEEIVKGHVVKFFPLHDEESLEKLRKEWTPNLLTCRSKQPMNDVKDYFGVKIAFYFAFIEYYNYLIIYPAVLGLALQIVIYVTQNNDHVLLPFYSVFILLWSQSFLDSWELKEGHYAMEWGVTNIERIEQDRSKFKGKEDIPDIITGEKKAYFSYEAKRNRLILSFFIVFIMTSLAILTVIGLYILKDYLEPTYGASAQTIVSFINAVQIGLGNVVYTILAKMLTDLENHRTDQAYGDFLTLKLSLFKFINSFGSFFYIAFFAPYLTGSDSDIASGFQGKCGAESCMRILRDNLAVIFLSQIVSSAAVQIFLPYFNFVVEAVKNRVKHWSMPGTQSYNKLSLEQKVEIQHSMPQYNPIDDGVEDFAEIAMQFGFLTLFVPALPVAGVFAIFFNLVQIKIDGMKLMDFHQRPFLMQDDNIGSWKIVFRLFTVLATFTNGGMVFFTMKLKGMDQWAITQKTWFFLFFLIGIWILQSVIKLFFLTSKRKREIGIQEGRQSYIVSKLFKKVKDEHDSDSFKDFFDLNDDDDKSDNGDEGDEEEGKYNNSVYPLCVSRVSGVIGDVGSGVIGGVSGVIGEVNKGFQSLVGGKNKEIEVKTN